MRRFVAAFFRHPFVLILPAILVPLIVVFIVRSFASSYQSQATVYVPQVPPTASLGSSGAFTTPAQWLQLDLTQYIQAEPSFLVKVANETDMPKSYAKGTPDVNGLMVARITAGIKVTAIVRNFVQIQYSDTNPRLAAQVIKAMLQEYINESLANAQQNINNNIDLVNQAIQDDTNALATDSAKKADYVQSHPNLDLTNDAGYAALQLQYQNDLLKLQSDQQRLQSLTGKDGQTNLIPFNITDEPTVPTTPVVKSKTTITAIVGGVALGLGISLGLIGLLAVADRRVHSRDDLVDAMPVPVLEVVPRLRGLENESMVGSEESLTQLAQVPVLVTLPRFAESTANQEHDRPFTNHSEDE
jgi:uncharacterized protein involved in exopolysaccharide biosynthesis